jgi:ubiquinone/menaquinone biosynthesis C-methylase UbiE
MSELAQSDRVTTEQAVRILRADPKFADLVRDSYLGSDVHESASRFLSSSEFREVRRLLARAADGSRILDLGAGTGIVSYAFAMSGADRVVAVEPDPSDEIGRGAISRLRGKLPIWIVGALGERLPLIDESIDVVYIRQTLHHAFDLPQLLRECARVLRPRGVLLACREHVVDDDRELEAFLLGHPVHRLAGGEHAYRLAQYISAITRAGLQLQTVLPTSSSIINAFPEVRDRDELTEFPRRLLTERFGVFGRFASYVPLVNVLVRARLWRHVPGRMYSFLAVKP